MTDLARMTIVLWAGLVLGGSLIAAPAKFQAPSLALPVALEVGRAQFLWLGYAEAACAALLIVVALRYRMGMLVLPVVLLALQRLALLPLLNTRTDAIIAGTNLPPSHLHLVFVLLEVAKLTLLLFLGWRLVRGGPVSGLAA